MLQWLKKLLKLVKNDAAEKEELRKQIYKLQMQLEATEKIIRDRTEMSVDVGYKESSTVILVGHYRGRDFVQCYNVEQNTFDNLIHRLREEMRYSRKGRIDAFPTFRAVIDREWQC